MRLPSSKTPPTGELVIRNRQRVRRVDTTLLRRLTLAVLAGQRGLKTYELGIHLVGKREMTTVNGSYLDHEGSTDIITFDHADPERGTGEKEQLHGELFICLDDAVAQACEFRTTWTAELARYVIHGILHLRGFDDRTPAARRRMKAVENRELRRISREFPLSSLARSQR